MSRRVAESERLARIALARLTEPGDMRMSALVAQHGAIMVRDQLLTGRDSSGVAFDVAARLSTIDPTRDLAVADRLGIRFVVPGDEEWPATLDDLAATPPVQDRGGPPLGLWVKGPLRLDRLAGSVAVVGSRSATTYGAEVARELGAGLARAGRAVLSGAAFGIDQAAHRGAVAADGPTVAVLACGVDRAYPPAHKALLDHLAETAAVVSELPPGCSPTRLRFLARNRLIAALACGTVVVEAALRSGALNTANWASRLNRHLMGVPGPVTSASSQGVHQLVRTGAATLVTATEEVLEIASESGEHLLEAPRGADGPRDRLTQRQRQVLDAVPVHRPASALSIARTGAISLLDVQSALTRLQARGLVEADGDGWRLAAAPSPSRR